MTRKKNENGLFDTSITRRDALKLMGGAAALAGASGLGFSENLFAQGSKKPNVIFILTDDHRWDVMGAMGHPFIQTPNMDRLANEGVLFENAFVTTSLCSPSRASFLTGQYASTHGVVNNFSRWDPETNITYLQHFKEAGYATAFIGKWHMPGTGTGLPELPGVDLFISFTRKDGQGDYWNCPIYKNYELVTEPRNPYITTDLTDYAIDFVKENAGTPFCMYLSHKAVHHDWRPPEHLKGKYEDADLSFLAPEGDKYNTMTGNNFIEGGMDDMHTRYRRYCECLESVDEELGRLLSTLEETGQLDNTVIVYAGDNGYIFGEHRLIAKHCSYEESIRIPYVVRAPGIIPDPGRRAEQMVLNLDLSPSLLELAGIPIPDSVQGESFAPILRSAKAQGRESFAYELFRDFPFGGRVPPHKAVRTEKHKYVEWEACRDPELYDLENDPREMNNLIGTAEGDLLAPELAAELESLRQRFNLKPGMV
ncbi:MAG: sulfatase [Deltaproteobacteria bacterium]|nr:sulfatase [Candidatus Zymogenaceae bacterium]